MVPDIKKVSQKVKESLNAKNYSLTQGMDKHLKSIIFIFLGIAIASSFVSYTLVLCKENDILNLHRETAEIQMENVNIKTEVEFAKSLYTVQEKASTLQFLHKPEKVIEVEECPDVDLEEISIPSRIINERVVGGY